MRRTLLSSVAAVSLAANGCATLVHGPTQRVSITSAPPAARVTIDDQPRAVTPVIVKLSRKRTHTLRVELDGYQPYTATMARKTSGWFRGNFVLGGFAGLAIDATSGSMYRLTPEQGKAQLHGDSVGSHSATTLDGLYVVLVARADPTWERVGSLVR